MRPSKQQLDIAQDEEEQENLISTDHEVYDIDDNDPLLPGGDDGLLIERLKNELASDLAGSDAYERQSRIVNRAIQDIGMGRYQWELFVLCGFGWFADKYDFLLIWSNA
jgi:hypothetical protein